jgi:hypothetical protein
VSQYDCGALHSTGIQTCDPRISVNDHLIPTGTPRVQHKVILCCTLWQFNIAIENNPKKVDLPVKHGDFRSYVSLPEGKHQQIHFHAVRRSKVSTVEPWQRSPLAQAKT